MTGSEIAALIVAGTGVAVAIFTGVRNLVGDKMNKDVQASAALLAGYTTMVTALQTEVERVKEDHLNDRKMWAEERAQMRVEHGQDLARMRDDHDRQMQGCSERIDELGTQVYVLENRPRDTRKRSTD